MSQHPSTSLNLSQPLSTSLNPSPPQPSAGKFNPSTPSTPKISIITVSFNSASTIADTLKAVFNQTYKRIEHIIVDGGSTDQTINIVEGFPHVAKCISEKDEGIYFAMNKGIAMASGDIIGILNADDLYADDEVIAKVTAVFEDPAVDATYADLVFVDRDDVSKVVRTWKSGIFTRSSMYNGWMPPHPTFFVRRAIYEKYGLFNTALRSAADYELMLRFLLKHEINLSYLPETIIKMRQGGKSTASISNRINANMEDRKAWKMNGLKPHFFTLILKPLRKIKQFISHG
ncbi:MAG: glycosyltransferase [Chitinophagaceae bacterium]|nr:glycosyltransferase [Chitinophagaceae bacterium]